MSSHPPGLPGLPMIPGLPGPSGVFGHALTQADRRRPEAEHKPLSLNIPGMVRTAILNFSPFLDMSSYLKVRTFSILGSHKLKWGLITVIGILVLRVISWMQLPFVMKNLMVLGIVHLVVIIQCIYAGPIQFYENCENNFICLLETIFIY